MRTSFFSFVLIPTFSVLGAAYSLTDALGDLPSCAVTCLVKAAGESTCATVDTACQCASEKYVATAEACVLTSCTVRESLVAKNVTQTLCGAPIRDKRVEYNVVSCTLISIAAVVVLFRLGYKKFFTSNDLGLDDWLILLTLISCIPSSALNVAMANYGLGKDIWTLTPDMITSFAKLFYIIAILYFSEVFLLKLSMLFFYLRIFPGARLQRVIWGTIIFDVLFGISFVLAATFQCTPISYNWTNWSGDGEGKCVNINAIAWANAAISIALDLWMLALPLSQLPSLDLHWKKKVGVGIMFCVGTFVTVVSVIRLTSIVEFRGSSNLTWDYWSVSLWSTVEIAVGIICACMPSIRLVLVRISPKIFDGNKARHISRFYPRKSQGGTRSDDRSKNRSSACLRYYTRSRRSGLHDESFAQ
ncbi:uncharacterized protein BCR38DRAFT_422325 [Pseudomassariella vexata]|uniref:CFEM domain-containing protein n=1 Tax=Pseudomassariella vexata TaxID=1141098 RepID=A0A1Y2EG17_9PEZI|nr:uncharacterized protein BCR38DRAFT_422325 [Pseudomassariella vexata]ORY70520.1 hypothetical protein BCR38DRAFT_422325 [Pseudomassariella vexata]